MADGTTKAIGDIKIGDKVTATDPATRQTTPEPVTVLHANNDTELTDLVVATDTGVDTVHTTQGHPFWDDSQHAWVKAGDLKVGEKLHTPDHRPVTVLTVHNFSGAKTMDNLTVNALHTYYVVAGSTPVLVHNCGGSVAGHRTVCDCANGGPPIGPRNGILAGGTHDTTGVPIDDQGFPDFSAWRHPQVPDVRIELSGDRGIDEELANAAAGLDETPDGYTWHHHQDCGLMQLIYTRVHELTGHTGGFTICK
jgi:hypothetical protein